MLRNRHWVAATIIALTTTVSDGARADSREAAARSLFEEARTLVAAGKADQACPKFVESERLVPGTGTEFNLADCYEKVGKTASAWELFLRVASQEKAAGQSKREEAARKRAADLVPRLSRLAVAVSADAAVRDLEVRRDGEVVGTGSWGSAVAVDPGEHAVSASAPGRKTWQSKVVVKAPGATETVNVPVLETLAAGAIAAAGPAESPSTPPSASPAPLATAGAGAQPAPTAATPPSAPAAPEGAAPGKEQRIAGYGALALGGVGLVVGTIYGLKRNSKQNTAKSHCINYPDGCDDVGVSANQEASSAGKVATVGFIAGGVLAATGVVLLLTTPSKSATPAPTARQVRFVPLLARDGGGLTLQGMW